MPSRVPPSSQRLPPTSRLPIEQGHTLQPPLSTTKPSPKVDRTSKPYLQRRSTVYAVGIAIIAGAGAIIGAQLKTRQQANEIKNQQLSASSTAAQSTPAAPTNASSLKVPVGNDSQDAANQLAFLESRRGQLLYQKEQTENKIRTLRERQKKAKELEMERERLKAEQRGGGEAMR